MKTGSIICLALFILGSLLSLAQLWFEPLTAEVFTKLIVTLVIVGSRRILASASNTSSAEELPVNVITLKTVAAETSCTNCCGFGFELADD